MLADPMYDQWLEAGYQADERVRDEDDAYWDSLMESEEDDGHPHDWEELLWGDLHVGWVCTHCGAKG